MQEVTAAKVVEKVRAEYLAKRWNLPAQNKNFTGRESLLEQISERLSGSKPLVISACHGLGGVGKTQLVTEYAYRNENKYERVLWITSESTDQIETAFLSLGQDLGIIPEKTPPAEAIHRVKDWLSSHPRNLIIFDNAENYEAIQSYVLPSGADILITSRHTVWPEKGVEVDVFSLEETVLYFRKIIGERAGDTKEKIEELAEELGRLPLALAQAAAYIRENKISTEKYLDLYRQKKAYFLSQNILPESDHHIPVYVTWDVSMSKIKRESVLAPALLSICSFLHCEKIPDFLLEKLANDDNYNPDNQELYEEARTRLLNYSMLTGNEEDNTVSLHRLVHEVVFLSLTTEEKTLYLEHVFRMLRDNFPFDKQTIEDIEQKRILLPHLNAVFPMIENDENKLLAFLVRMEEVYKVTEDAKKTKNALKRILLIKQSHLPSNHPEIAMVLNNLGNAYHNLGDNLKSIKLLTEALMLKEQSFGPEHFEVAATLTNLALPVAGAGDEQKAKELLERALQIFGKQYAHQPLNMGKALVNLGTTYGNLGNIQKSKALLEQALTIFEEHYRADHPDVAGISKNLGNAYWRLGEFKKSKELFQRVLCFEEKFYGPEHPLVAQTLVNLGNVYGDLNDLPEQKKLLERALPMLEKHYGLSHLSVIKTLNNLANNYRGLKNPQKSVEILTRALDITEKCYGPDHPQVSALLNNLGNAYRDLGWISKQKELLYRSLPIDEKHYGKGHPQVAITLYNLAAAHFVLNELAQAYEECSKALQIFMNHPDTCNHPQTPQCQHFLQQIVSKMQSQSTDVEVVEKRLVDDVNNLRLRLRLASLYLSQNNLEKSIFHYQMAVPFLQGRDATSVNHNLGCLYQVKGDLKSAESCFRAALCHEPTASTYSDYGLFLYKQNRFDDAIKNFACVFSLKEDRSGLSYGKLEVDRLDDYLKKEIQDNGDLNIKPIFMAYYWIIRCYQQLEQKTECENYLVEFRKAVEISAEPLCWRLLSYTYEYLGKKDELDECREMLSAIEFSKQMSDAEAIGQFGLHPFPPRSPTVEKPAEFQEKRECKK